MRILICDDDTLIIEQLQKYIESYFESNHLKCPELVSFTSGESLLAEKSEKDIVFLDIEMPGMNGIYVGNELKKTNKNVIIFVVTSYSEYLDEAMRFHVFRYLSKPLDKQRFFRNMKDALAYYNSITTKIPVETKQGVYSFPASQIITIEAQGRKVIVHTTRQDFDSIHNMDYWLEQLPNPCGTDTHLNLASIQFLRLYLCKCLHIHGVFRVALCIDLCCFQLVTDISTQILIRCFPFIRQWVLKYNSCQLLLYRIHIFSGQLCHVIEVNPSIRNLKK